MPASVNAVLKTADAGSTIWPLSRFPELQTATMSEVNDSEMPPPPDVNASPGGGSEIPAVRPEELPPVEPPSAGYIVQLFLIPALIVAAVIGVWALFGMLADTDADWRQMVKELGSSNEDRRWRAAFVLAQILRNEEIAPERREGPLLADQPEVATALSELLRESLASANSDDDTIMHQEFLARTLGSLRADDVILPVLADAMQPQHNIEVRKSSLMALANIAGRNFTARAAHAELLEPDRQYGVGEEVVTLRQPLSTPTIDNAEVWEQLKNGTQDEEASIRHLSAFVIGVVSGPDAVRELKAVLLDRDDKTRANAAVGLARNGQIDGLDVLTELLEAGFKKPGGAEFDKLSVEDKKRTIEAWQFEQPTILSNSLRALDSIWVALSAEDHAKLRPVLEKVASEYRAANVQMQAKKVLNRFDN